MMHKKHRKPEKVAVLFKLNSADNAAVVALAAAGRGDQAFALGFLAGQLAGAADSFGLLTGTLFRRLLVIVAQFHLTKHAFTLKLLLKRFQRLIHIVVTNDYLHAAPRLSNPNL